LAAWLFQGLSRHPRQIDRPGVFRAIDDLARKTKKKAIDLPVARTEARFYGWNVRKHSALSWPSGQYCAISVFATVFISARFPAADILYSGEDVRHLRTRLLLAPARLVQEGIYA
jgi:hypothetical protein